MRNCMFVSSISRRIESSINGFQQNDFESALVHYFPALDKTAKKRYPKDGVGKRIKKFLDDELDIITYIATQNILRINVNGITFPEAIYKFGRTSIAHEGELDPRLNFNNESGMSIGQLWNLPPSFIIGLIISVVLAPENNSEQLKGRYTVAIHGDRFDLSTQWGNRSDFRSYMEQKFGRAIFENNL
ncbi:Putative uncharacterized protein [Moritella viscosa]|uniref:Uncharacterized protein n=2 Tax=Moritella viscosa TaxID=80854 RepID=A0A1L0BKM2_9GAMM|nr:Putative uncharacterized protein [Moritella viscosa]SHO08562.1 Putative uncharacterized protein [Moritella viscosa]SHO08599.1 Putative uncharacterized protein [Moritella viscosa]SHO13073.1 Putative uncharacterized protein [Moritella viscosa]SHO16489.1 Putative uncharacterized protein [Moritella viscosa]